MLALEQRFFLTDHNLICTDKMSMAAQLRAACGIHCVYYVQRGIGLRDERDEESRSLCARFIASADQSMGTDNGCSWV